MLTRTPFLGQVPLRPRLACGMMPLPNYSEEDETTARQAPSGMLGCEDHRPNHIEGCSKCRRKRKRDWTLTQQEEPSEMISRRGSQSVLRGDTRHSHAMGQICPLPGSSSDPANFGPDVACQKTASGDVICSNNVIYSGSCPHAPAVNVPGVAANMPGTTVPQAPPPLSAAAVSTPAAAPGAVAPSAAAPSTLPIVAGVVGVGVLALLLFR